MRRKILIGVIALLSVILLIVIGLFWYIRSGRLDLFVQNQIIVALKDFGIRTEIGKTHLDLGGYTVTLDDIKLYAGDGQKPFGSVQNLKVQFSIVDYLKQKINITQVVVTHPSIWLEINEQGQTNLDQLHAPPKSDKESTIRFLTAFIEVNNGVLNFVDNKNKVEATLPDFYAKFDPREPEAIEDKINHTLSLNFDDASAKYQGRPIEKIKADIEAIVTGESAEINKFQIASDVGDIEVTDTPARVTSYDPLKYNFAIKADARLAEISRVFLPEQQMSGAATIVARVEGTGADYRINNASVNADSLTVEGFRIAEVRVTSDANGEGEKYDATLDLKAGPINGKDIDIASIRLSDARVSGVAENFDITGGLTLDSLKSGKITVKNLRGRLDADPDKVSLSNLSASALGGNISGSATVAYGGGQSRVDVQFSSIDLNQVATLAAKSDVDVRGTANGTARLTFPGVNFEAATGPINATFEAAVSPTQPGAETLPAQGRISVVASGGGFNINEAYVKSNQSELTVSGRVSSNLTASLDVNLKSDDMAEVQRAVEGFGLIPADIQEKYQVALTGPGQFNGRVEGRVTQPRVTGHVRLENVQAQNELIGSFESDVSFTPAEFNLENAELVRPDQSRVSFNVNGPIGTAEGAGGISLHANVDSFDLSTLARLAAPELGDIVGGGKVSGRIDLSGLPGPRGISGTADVTVTSAAFNLPSAEEGKESEKLEVPLFKGQVSIENSVLTARDLQVEVGGSQITGELTFNLDTYAYSVDAQGKGIDLSQVAGAFSDSVNLTGTADVNITGRGDWDDLSTANLNATIQGQNVALNGRDLGDAKIVAFTEGGQLKVEATGNVLNEQRTLRASIDLTDRKNYPITSTIELNNEELGPYLELISPGLSTVTGRATGTISLSGPLQNPDQLQATINLSQLVIGGKVSEAQTYTLTNQGDVVITASPKEVTLKSVTFTGEGTSISLGGTISREETVKSNLTIDGEINLRLISSFTQDIFVTGIAKVDASITGALTSPRLLGTVDLRDVGARVVGVPVSINQGQGLIRFTASQVVIDNFNASTPGGGTLSLNGGAAAPSDSLVPNRWRIEARADQVGMEYPRDTLTVFDADLVLQGNPRFQLLSGNVDVRRAAYTKDITLQDLVSGGGPFGSDFLDVGPGGGSGGGVGGGVGGGPALSLDIRVNANETLIIRNNLADAVGSAFINIRGTVNEPQPSGRIQLSRGTLEFRNDRYEITRGLITLPPGRNADPIFDVKAEAEVSGYQIRIGFSGPLAKLKTTLESDPNLPEGDIVSLVLTGNLSSNSSTSAAATQTGLGLAQSLLSASLSAKLEEGAQRLFGLSRFSVDPLIVGRGSDPTARITIGQRIAKNLTVTYSQNLTSGSGQSGVDRIILVEYRISNRFSVVGFRNERGELGFDVRVRKRF